MRLNYDRDTRFKYQTEEYAHKYDTDLRNANVKKFRTRLVAWDEKRIVKKYLARLEVPLTVADIPCGTGKLSGILADGNTGIVAGDISAAMMNFAKVRYVRIAGFRGFVRLDATHCPFEDKCFDCVVALRLMHRVPEALRAAMLKEFARISKDYVVVSYGIASFYQKLRGRLRRIFLEEPAYRKLAISRTKLTDEISDAGLRIIEISPVLHGLSCEIIVLAAKTQ